MNRRLAAAVINCFRDTTSATHYTLLAGFNTRDWTRSYHWLDESGLALYFLARLKELRIENAIPTRALLRLEENLADNRNRTAKLFEEFIGINELFQKAEITYTNLKGFTLIPDISPDAALRCQFDLDFAIASRDVQRCQQLLMQQGYWLTGSGNNSLEFKAGSGKLPSVHDLYKPSSQRCVELHFSASEDLAEERSYEKKVLRSNSRLWDDLELPVLSESDKFLSLASHLFKHLKSEWTRISWILEYANYIRSHQKDEELWSDVQNQVKVSPEMKVAVGAATMIANQAFGISSLPGVLSSAVTELPIHIRLWIERYGDAVLFAVFPGSKLYLLLDQGQEASDTGDSRKRRRKLIPLHRPPKVVHTAAGESWSSRLKSNSSQLYFSYLRLKFHFKNGLRYMIEAPRWKRYIAEQQCE